MKTKKINRLNYEMVFDTYNKTTARKEAENYRQAGHSVRTFTVKSSGAKTVYEVFVSLKRFKRK